MASAWLLAHQVLPRGTAYVLGKGGLISSLHQNGYALLTHSPDFAFVREGWNVSLEIVNHAVDMILDGTNRATARS